jgi:two-component system, OmpR family, KDP operon response regulator KdpE
VGVRRQQRSVLICDSDLPTLRALRAVLCDAGHRVWPARTAKEALTHAALHAPEAVIVEMDLVDCSGTEVCRRLRQSSSMPIVILSCVSSEDRIVEAFGAGATDYISKPFRPRELIARLEAHMQRALTDGDEPVIRCGGLIVDLASGRIFRDDEEVRLTATEYRLLYALVRNRGRLLTHDALLNHVWGAAHPEARQALRAHMANLRRKLADAKGIPTIRTYPGVGYLFEDGASERTALRSLGRTPVRSLQVGGAA